MKIKIERIINKINEKENLKLLELECEHLYINKILYIFLKDFLITERLNEKTEEEILNINCRLEVSLERYNDKPDTDIIKKLLNLLCERGILLKSNRKTLNNDLIDIYCLSYAYINNLENHNSGIEIKKTSDTIAEAEYVLEEYQKFNNRLIGCIAEILEYGFNFHVERDNEKIDFQMGGCDYNVYLSRGYIVLEEADNSTIDNAWTVEDINEFVDLIKDLLEDN